MRSSRLSGLVLVAVVATVTATGCGGDDGPSNASTSTATDTQATTATSARTTTSTTASKGGTADPAPGRTVQAFYNEMSERDGDTACTYLNEQLRTVSIGLVRKRFPGARDVNTCGEALKASVGPASAAQLRILRDVKILSSTVAGGVATVAVGGAPSDVLLTKAGDRWLISAGIFRS